MEAQTKTSFYGVFIWLLGLLFFFYEFFLRIFLGTIATEVSQGLHLSINEFSIVASAYYITYAAMQIPVGILTEKIGTRIVLSSAALICTIGVLWLAASHSFYPALISRLLIGFGSAFAFVSLLIIALNWFDQKHFSFLCGIALFLGAVGPMLAGAPLAYVNELLDGNWRLVLLFVGLYGLVLTCLLALFMRNKPPKQEKQIIFITPYESLGKKLFELLKNRQAWCILICASSLYAPLPLLAAYFGTSYLQTQGFEKTSAAFIISMVWVGYAIGNPLFGKMSDYFKRRTPFLYLTGLLGCIISLLILYASINQYMTLIFFFLLLGLASSTQGLAYALIVEHTPKKNHSAALGLNNTGGMLFGAIFPYFSGLIIQSSLHGKAAPAAENYLKGLSLIPFLYALATLFALFLIKETFCRQQHEVFKLQPLHKASDLF